MIAAGHDAKFRATSGVDDHMVACFEGQTVGGKIINLLSGSELNVHNLYDSIFVVFHWLLLIETAVAVNFIVIARLNSHRWRLGKHCFGHTGWFFADG